MPITFSYLPRSVDGHLPLPRQIFITTFGKILRASLYTETIQEKFIKKESIHHIQLPQSLFFIDDFNKTID